MFCQWIYYFQSEVFLLKTTKLQEFYKVRLSGVLGSFYTLLICGPLIIDSKSWI